MDNQNSSSKLTVGMIKVLISGQNIPELEKLVLGRADDEILDLLDRNLLVAAKIWYKEDIEAKLEEKGYAPLSDNVELVLEENLSKQLEQCTDDDWALIENAISECSGKLRKGCPTTRKDFEQNTNWKMSYEEYQSCYCPTCKDSVECIHSGAFRRVPKIDDGLGLCPNLKR